MEFVRTEKDAIKLIRNEYMYVYQEGLAGRVTE